jgi:hypothetical protein
MGLDDVVSALNYAASNSDGDESEVYENLRLYLQTNDSSYMYSVQSAYSRLSYSQQQWVQHVAGRVGYKILEDYIT